MEGSKVKNIVLLILLITNLLLLFLMVSQRLESRQLQEKALTDAVQLLEAKGVSVKADNLTRIAFPAAMTLERDAAWEQQSFAALLGEGTTVTQRGLVAQYRGPLGEAEVRSDGEFSVSLIPGAYPVDDGDRLACAQTALKLIHFTADLTETTGETLVALQKIDDSPVYSCRAVLRFEGESLVSIFGTRLVGQPVQSADSEPLSVATLLVRFRANLIESGEACTAILSASQGYLLSSTSGKMELLPVLRLETDTSYYYLSALTGEILRA